MQILAHTPEFNTYSNETGNYITGFLIGTKLNAARWAINKQTGHKLVQQFLGKDFAIIPELIHKPLSKGGGGHYFGQDTKEDLLAGYAKHSHGKYVKIRGPYSYNDGTDDYYYNADIQLRDSKAAAVLLEHGAKTWVPFSVSPHIFPRLGEIDEDIKDWEAIGGALVIKGAFGDQAVITKLCQGTPATCEKSLGGAIAGIAWPPLCNDEDTEIARNITSLVSKAGSIQVSMPDSNTPSTNTAAPPVNNSPVSPPTTPTIEKLTTDQIQPNSTIDSQARVTESPRIVTVEEHENTNKRLQELEKANAALVRKDRLNTLNNMFAMVKNEKTRNELVDKYKNSDKVDELQEFLSFVYPILKKADSEAVTPEPEVDSKKVKGKGGSIVETNTKPNPFALEPEPELLQEGTESKAGSTVTVVNKAKVIADFLTKGSF